MMYTELKLNIGWLVLVLPFSSYQQQEGRHELGRSCEEEQLRPQNHQRRKFHNYS